MWIPVLGPPAGKWGEHMGLSPPSTWPRKLPALHVGWSSRQGQLAAGKPHEDSSGGMRSRRDRDARGTPAKSGGGRQSGLRLIPWLIALPLQFKFRLSERKLAVARASPVERMQSFQKIANTYTVPAAGSAKRIRDVNSLLLPSSPGSCRSLIILIFRGGFKAQRGRVIC